jgi:hypothetical protein
MANQWLRLWHDMPTDPKWRTIARVSGQPISMVQAVYLHLLVDASRNVTRGHATVTKEDLASALDASEDTISAVLDAMQGRVMDGDYLSGWDKRQVKREDSETIDSAAKSAAERKREQRERERESRNVTQCHEASRNVTLDKDKSREDKDITTTSTRVDQCPVAQLIGLFAINAPSLVQPRIVPDAVKAQISARWRESEKHQSLDFWRDFFAYCETSDFLAGRTDGRGGKPFRAGLEWIVKASNFAKIINGNYHTESAA